MNESLQQQAFRELASETCACSSEKLRGQSFCRACFFALPNEMRTALFQRDGYANTWDDAKEWLRTNTTRIKK